MIGAKFKFLVQKKIGTRSLITRSEYVPDYSSPDPGNLRKYVLREPRVRQPRISKPFWEYQAPSASIGSPEGYQFEPVTIPQYGAGDGGNSKGGGGWGGGGRGGNDGDGDPMKGFTYLFAALVFGFGALAYLRRKSTKSLFASSAVAGLLIVSASLMGLPNYRIGSLLALATCVSLALLMGYRAKKSGKLMPGGLVAALSLLMSFGYVAALL